MGTGAAEGASQLRKSRLYAFAERHALHPWTAQVLLTGMRMPVSGGGELLTTGWSSCSGDATVRPAIALPLGGGHNLTIGGPTCR